MASVASPVNTMVPDGDWSSSEDVGYGDLGSMHNALLEITVRKTRPECV